MPCVHPVPVPTPAHPRSRGEHGVPVIHADVANGSSPLARGTYVVARRRNRRYRLIPARAGNISSRVRGYALRSAHPRSRGEHFVRVTILEGLIGSSPLARGTCYTCKVPENHSRLIPARAGNILADMGVYPLHQQNRITLKPEPHPGYTINSHS